jgi:hypothetical protein
MVAAGCAGDGKTLRDPIFGMPDPPAITTTLPPGSVPVTAVPVLPSAPASTAP